MTPLLFIDFNFLSIEQYFDLNLALQNREQTQALMPHSYLLSKGCFSFIQYHHKVYFESSVLRFIFF